ncbi:hypothetical protein Tco_0873330 [Tanacetum coccineum]
MCRALSRIPTVGTFRRFYVNSISNGWDPLSVDEVVDLPCVELLNENRTLIRKYLETFLCFVGLSRSFTNTDVRPTLLHDNDEEMGLLDFVKSVDPFKVGVKLVMEGKSPSAMWRLSRQNEQSNTGSGSADPVTEDVTSSSSVIPTPKRVLEDVSHDNVRTHPPPGRFFVLSSGYVDIDIPASPKVVSPITSAPTVVNAPVVEPVGDDRRSSGSGPETRFCPLHRARVPLLMTSMSLKLLTSPLL